MSKHEEQFDKVTPSNAKLLINQDNARANEVAEGFHILDDKIIERNPPEIKWGKLFLEFNDQEKIQYLKNLASTMNHAAYLIQKERDELNKLCALKEAQIEKAKKAMDDNLHMVDQQIREINEERQKMNSNSKKLKGHALREYLNSLKEVEA